MTESRSSGLSDRSSFPLARRILRTLANSSAAEAPATIELRLEKVALLFDPYDPFPTPSRDLAKTAEEFIVGWAREVPARAPLRILVHLPAAEITGASEAVLREAIARHFSYRADRVRGDLQELFRYGRISLVVGLAVLGLCIVGVRIAGMALAAGPVSRVFSEGLLILGWVANWRPIEIFLYDWWPLVQRRRLFRRLAEAQVSIRPS